MPPCLVTKQSCGEGAQVLKLKHQLFTGLQQVADFFNAGGNAALLDKPLIMVTNLKESGSESRFSVFALLLGAGSFIVDRRTLGMKTSNLKFSVHPEQGCNDGFITAEIKTHNGCGVTARKALGADFGDAYIAAPVRASAAASRFRSVLSMLVDAQAANEMDCDAPSPSPAPDRTGISGKHWACE
jgi:hypothetical protein